MTGAPTYDELIERLRRYRDDRDWKQFHAPKDLAIAISTEAGELLDHFLWRESAEVIDPVGLQSEVADVGIYLLFLCDSLGVDLLDVIQRKLEKNLGRHPVAAARGRSRTDC